MKKRWKVMLMLVAVICFGISLSYPLKYKMEEKSTEATMEKLVELRDAGLAKRGGRGDGRQKTSAAETVGTVEAAEEAEETEEAEEAGKESAEESGLGAESAQPEGAAPSDLEGEGEAASEEAEPEPEAEPEAEPEPAVEAAAVSEAKDEASEAEATLEQPAEPEQPAEQEQPSEAAITQEQPAEPSEQSEAAITQEQPAEASEAEAAPGEAATAPEQPAEASEAEVAPSEQSEAAATQKQPAESAEPSEAEAEPEQADEADKASEAQPATLPQGKSEGGSAAQVLPGATKRTFATPVPGPTPVPTPTSMPTPTPEPTATPTPAPTVNRFERSGAEPYEKLVKRTLDESKILPEFQEIYAENPDFVGWITIPDTAVDYPVVQTEDSDYYLHHDFFGEKNANGQIILDTKCDPYTPSYNLVVSGHSMRSGKMFGRLVNYMDESYWEKHKLVYFDTLMDERTYVVFAAFFSADYDVDETGFRYNADIQYSVDSRQWLREIDENKLYDTGIDVEFGDEFLTLTTCNKAHRSDGRFVVVCRRLREGEEIE